MPKPSADVAKRSGALTWSIAPPPSPLQAMTPRKRRVIWFVVEVRQKGDAILSIRWFGQTSSATIRMIDGRELTDVSAPCVWSKQCTASLATACKRVYRSAVWLFSAVLTSSYSSCMQASRTFKQYIETYLFYWGYRGGSPTAVRSSDPALCGSCPLVTPYYCRLGDLLCYFVYIVLCVHYCLMYICI